MLALGDTAYAEFCAIGKTIDERLAALGGKRVVDRVDCDLDFAEPAATWIGDALKALAPPRSRRAATVIEVDFGSQQPAPNTEMVEAEVSEHDQPQFVALGQGNDPPRARLRRRRLRPTSPATSLDLYAENDPAYVDELLEVGGLASTTRCAPSSSRSRDVTTLSLKTVETYAATTGHQYVKALIADRARRRTGSPGASSST